MLVVGVDGGGTGCRAAVEVDGHVCAVAEGGAANVTSDPETAIRNVVQAVEAAARQAKVDVSGAIAHVGLAGVMGQEDAAWVAARLPFAQVAVSDDRPTMVAGALGNEDGSVAAIGTGSFVATRHRGEFRFAGGWGLAVSDQASGAWLGREVLARALMCFDGLEPYSALTVDVMREFGDDGNAIVSFSQKAAPSDFAEFAPMIVNAALAKDAIGVDLMATGARYLRSALKAVGCSSKVCLTGGVGPHYAPYLEGLKCERPSGSALDGALMLARSMA